MQLIRFNLLLVLFFLIKSTVFAQQDALQHDSLPRVNRDKIKLSLLYSYYQQEGEHSAVEGGKGTQQLNDHAPALVLTMPVDSFSKVAINMGIDVYSSASTDNINSTVSSASAVDERKHISINYSKSTLDELKIWQVGVRYSDEWDYRSNGINASLTKHSPNKNKSFTVGLSILLDEWLFDKFGFLLRNKWREPNALTSILPEELVVYQLTDKHPKKMIFDNRMRQTYNFKMNQSFVVNKKLQMLFAMNIVHQKGLLATPFHRVYFNDNNESSIEQLPTLRTKIPFGLRANYYVNNYMIVRSFFRYYYDTHKINAWSAEVEIPLKINRFCSIYPFVRVHHQNASPYFKPYKEVSSNDTYYTSDYDLSSFISFKWGLGINYSPVYPLAKFKLNAFRTFELKSMQLRWANYFRNDGLSSQVLSFQLDFQF